MRGGGEGRGRWVRTLTMAAEMIALYPAPPSTITQDSSKSKTVYAHFNPGTQS